MDANQIRGRLVRSMAVGCAFGALALTGGCLSESDDVAIVQQGIANVGNEHVLLDYAGGGTLENLSTDWIPSSQISSGFEGRIVSAFSLEGEGSGAWYGYTADVSGSGLTNWQNGGAPAGINIGNVFRWDDPAHPWPEPSNLCDLYFCGAGDSFLEYSDAVKVLRTNHTDVAVIVAIVRVQTGAGVRADVAAVSSIDGGRTFTEARIISTDASGFSPLGLDPQKIDATTIVSTKVGSEREEDHTAAQYATWFNGNDLTWYITKFLVDPSSGHIALLSDPLNLNIGLVSAGTTRVSVAAYEDYEGLENVVLVHSEVLNQENQPIFGGAPSCPTDQTVRVRWWYSRNVGLFDHQGQSPGLGAPPNFKVVSNFDTDDEWHPCVGPSFSPSSSANPNFVNDERAVVTVNRRPRALVRVAYVKTDTESGRTRVNVMDRGLTAGFHNTLVPSDVDLYSLPGEEGTEVDDYNPAVQFGQGSLTMSDPLRSMRAAVARKRVREDDEGQGRIAIIGRTEEWTITATSSSFLAVVAPDANVVLSPYSLGGAPEGTNLGLAERPICYHDTYGACVIGNPNNERVFHVAFPRSPLSLVRGIAFEH